MTKYVVTVKIEAPNPAIALWNVIYGDSGELVEGVVGFSVESYEFAMGGPTGMGIVV